VQPVPNNGKGKDTVSHKKLWKTMLSMGFTPHLFSLIKSLYIGKSDWFNVLKGAYYLLCERLTS